MAVAERELCALVWALCRPRGIPTLVTDRIAEFLERKDALKISLLSHELNRHAEAFIYRDVVLDLSKPASSGRTAVFLLRTLVTSKSAASSIRNLSLLGFPLLEWRSSKPPFSEFEHFMHNEVPPNITFDLETFTNKEAELLSAKAASSVGLISDDTRSLRLQDVCLAIIFMSTDLSDLEISSDYFRYPDFRAKFRDMIEAGGCRNCRRARFCLDVLDYNPWIHIEAVRHWDAALLAPFFVKGIDSIATPIALSPGPLAHLNLSTVSRLELYHLQTQLFDLSSVLTATPNLRHLEYHAITSWHWFREHHHDESNERGERRAWRNEFGLDPLFNALHHVSDTLTELVLTRAVQDNNDHYERGFGTLLEPAFRRRTELSNSSQLRTLSIPLISLIGFEYQERQSWEWQNLLPRSLCSLTVTDHLSEHIPTENGWEGGDKLLPVFQSLVTWLATNSNGHQRPAFAIDLLDHDDDLFGREFWPKLYTICEELGVACSIEFVNGFKTKPPAWFWHTEHGHGAQDALP